MIFILSAISHKTQKLAVTFLKNGCRDNVAGEGEAEGEGKGERRHVLCKGCRTV